MLLGHSALRSRQERPEQTSLLRHAGNSEQQGGTGPVAGSTIFRTGHNCWAVTRADRAVVRIDSSEYFRAFMYAALNARETLFIVGWDFHSRAQLLLTNPEKLAEQLQAGDATTGFAGGVVAESRVMTNGRARNGAPPPPPAPKMMRAAKADADMAVAQEEPAPIRVRSDFNALALFSPAVVTDSAGRATSSGRSSRSTISPSSCSTRRRCTVLRSSSESSTS